MVRIDGVRVDGIWVDGIWVDTIWVDTIWVDAIWVDAIWVDEDSSKRIWVDVVRVDFSGRVANTRKEEQATIEEQIKITGHNHPEKNFTDIGMRRKNFTRDNSVRSFIIF